MWQGLCCYVAIIYLDRTLIFVGDSRLCYGVDPCELEVEAAYLLRHMSDSEHDASVLGKRARNGPEADIAEDADMNPPSTAQEDDESDDDVGPMPMPEDAAPNTATKKKRKGAFGIGAHWSDPNEGPRRSSPP